MDNIDFKTKPDIDLSTTLELSCPEEIYQWMEDEIEGLKYIIIEKYINRGNYNRVSKIYIQDKPRPNQKPPYKPDEIVHQIYLILQHQLQEQDESGKYKIVLYKANNRKGNNVKSKHVIVGLDPTNEQTSGTFDPDRVEGDLATVQLQYILAIQDANANLMNIVTNVIKPLSDQNKHLMELTGQIYYGQVEKKRLELQAEALQKAQEEESRIEMYKLQKSSETKQQALEILHKTGALKTVLTNLSGLIPGANKTSNVKPPQEKEKTPEERERDFTKEYKEKARKEPLKTHLYLLSQTLETNTKQLFQIKELLREDLYEKFLLLIDSESEEVAVENLKVFNEELKGEDFEILLKINSEILDEAQTKIIEFIMGYDPK